MPKKFVIGISVIVLGIIYFMIAGVTYGACIVLGFSNPGQKALLAGGVDFGVKHFVQGKPIL